jgi:hypothetical protein
MEEADEPLRLPASDQSYRLSADDRARVRPGFDADALERLLQAIRPDMRQEILAHFQFAEDTTRQYGYLVQFHDPKLQPLLEEVWAPMWDELNARDEDIERDVYGYPGREIALKRRAARRGGAGEIP